jgi:hypothetical protein
MAAEGPKVLQSFGPRVQSSLHKYIKFRRSGGAYGRVYPNDTLQSPLHHERLSN